MPWPCPSSPAQGPASSSAIGELRLRIGWWPKTIVSSSALLAAASSLSSHLNCGSSMLPSADGPGTPPSETVSTAMKRKPLRGDQE
jgi:hypothetical protein